MLFIANLEPLFSYCQKIAVVINKEASISCKLLEAFYIVI